jgi:alkanesulfonate monooxygenase SsuD/methylene tetrahydromethanopterin reductase-like flavin-dependent oxidoreductase (luciferase family)
MRFGLHTGQHQTSYAEIRDLWRDAAVWGFDACYVFDHVVPLYSDVEAFLPEEALGPDGPCLEGFTTLAALGRDVPGVNVGLMVAAVSYRAPSLLTHIASTLAGAAPDRYEIGIGGGWFEREYPMLGLPFPSARDRLEQLEHALNAFRDAFGERRPRLWVAGVGERRLLPLAARLADSWNAMYLTPEEFAAKVAVLAAVCADGGRDPESIERSIALRAFCARDARRAEDALSDFASARGRDAERVRARSLVGTPKECTAQLDRYAAAGATHCAVMAHPPYDREGLELLAGEVFPRVGSGR